MTKQSTDMTQPVPARAAPAREHQTATPRHARGVVEQPGDSAIDSIQLAAAGVAEIARRYDRNEDDEAAWLPTGKEATAADAVGSTGAAAEAAGASSVIEGSSATGAVADAAAGASGSSAAGAGAGGAGTASGSTLLTAGAILGTVAVAAALNGSSGSSSGSGASAHLASGAGRQSGSAADDNAQGDRGNEGTDDGTGSGASTSAGASTEGGSDTDAGDAGTGAIGTGSDSGATGGSGAADGSGADGSGAAGSGASGDAGDRTAETPDATPAADPANTRSLTYDTNDNKAVGAAVFNGTGSDNAPEFIRITAIRGKNAGSANGLMTLEDGEEITVGQIISRADFERIFWNASKSDGSFSFVAVQDAQGTAVPDAVVQTIVIRTPDSAAADSDKDIPGGETGDAGHGTGSRTDGGTGSATTTDTTDTSTDTASGAGAGTGTGAGADTGSASGSGTGSGTAGTDAGTDHAADRQSGTDDGKVDQPVSGQDEDPQSGTGTDDSSGQNAGDRNDASLGDDKSDDAHESGTDSGSGSDADTNAGSASGSGSGQNEESDDDNSDDKSGNSDEGSDGDKDDNGDAGGNSDKDDNGDAGGNSNANGGNAGNTVPSPAHALPEYAADQSILQHVLHNNEAVGARIFNGTKTENAPSFIKITAILNKDGVKVEDAMTLGKDGEAITPGQVIGQEHFGNVFLDALKVPGGSFRFIPVLDMNGTPMPDATEQTIGIRFNYLTQLPGDSFSGMLPKDQPGAYYKVMSVGERDDENGKLDGLLMGENRTPVQENELIHVEGLEKLYWDYTSNDGGFFQLAALDRNGKPISVIDEDGMEKDMVLDVQMPKRDGSDEPEDGDEDAGVTGKSVSRHHESPVDTASAFQGSSLLSMNGQNTLDHLLEQQMNHSQI